ncbi:hypothetical protein QUB63_20805 [Microcoleus sp. ARI1-B5]|uniref:hypothetical protein n=1 Tax=unclassified Microcoleus TaxID=2642155 RepID=UPI002FD78A95
MTSNLWKLDRTTIPESMECSGTALTFTLTKYSQPWQRINTVDSIVQQCGTEPFAEVLGVPKSGILGKDIPESARKPHPNLLFRALAIQALGKVREGLIPSVNFPLSSDYRENLLAVLEQEARGGATPLIQWSAAVSMQSIWLDEAGQGQGKESAVNVTINAAEIERQVVEEQIKLLASHKFAVEHSSRNDSGKEYENCRDFWVYGPSWLVPGVPMDCEEYLFWLDRVFAAIALRGDGYKFKTENDAAVTNFLEVAQKNFNDLEFSQILAKIFEFLHHPEATVKNLSAIILEPYKDRLDRKSAQIMTALVYKFQVKNQPLESLTIPEIEECKASLSQGQMEIDEVYSEALSLCGDDVEMANLLSAKQREYQNSVGEHINNLSKLVKSIVDCQSLLDANRELLYLTVERLQEWDYTLGNKLAAHRKKLQNLSVDKSTSEQCINLDNDLNFIRDSVQYTLYEVTSKINSRIRDLELSASKNNKTATEMFKWTWVLLGVWFSIGLLLYLSDAVINSILTVNYYQSEFLVYWTVFFIVMVVFLLVLAIFFATLAALDKRRESKLIPKFDSLSQIGNSFSILWQKSYLQQFVPSVRSN